MQKSHKNIVVLISNHQQINALKAGLLDDDFKVTVFNSEKKMMDALSSINPFLILIELDFTDRDGITITTEIRKKTMYYPFVFLFSTKMDDYVQIAALNAGADDFIQTPFKVLPLKTRIKAYQRRFLLNTIVTEDKMQTNFVVDRDKYAVFINAKQFLLPRKEFEILHLMYSNPQKIFTRSEIGNSVWGTADVSKTRTIDIHIRNIRQIIGNQYVFTKKNVGYFFSSPK